MNPPGELYDVTKPAGHEMSRIATDLREVAVLRRWAACNHRTSPFRRSLLADARSFLASAARIRGYLASRGGVLP